MKKDGKIYVAGHLGLAGSALVRSLERHGFSKFLFRSIDELNLQNAADTDAFFAAESPDYVFLAAAKVGGIQANNTYPADFIRDNLQIQTNVIDAAWRNGVKRLLFLGSSCIYRHRNVLVLQPAIRNALSGRDAHEYVRARRQLQPGNFARAAGADPQGL